jgi:cytochrome c
MGTTTVAQGMMGPGMMQSPAPPAPGAAGAAIFRSQCSPCHSLQAGSAGLPGPSLHGLFGRKAGTVAGFNYSTAMRDSGVVWNERTLDQYIAAPQTFIPGDIMPFAGLADTAARQRLIAYLKSATR